MVYGSGNVCSSTLYCFLKRICFHGERSVIVDLFQKLECLVYFDALAFLAESIFSTQNDSIVCIQKRGEKKKACVVGSAEIRNNSSPMVILSKFISRRQDEEHEMQMA